MQCWTTGLNIPTTLTTERKGQGQKPLLNRTLRWYCLRNINATMMDIATWAQYCYSTQSASASKNATLNCIMQRRHL